MFSRLFAVLVCTATVIRSAAIGFPPSGTTTRRLHQRDVDSPYSIFEPNGDGVRAAAITVKQQTFLYGPDPIGSPVFYPTGSLGTVVAAADFDSLIAFMAVRDVTVGQDATQARAAVEKTGGINKLADYDLLYSPGLWSNSASAVFDSGMQTNYTQDLLFSMERLSINPYSIERLNPTAGATLPFAVDDALVQKLSGQTLEQLFTSGHLFYVDYSNQVKIPLITGRYAGGCEAYFFIHPDTDDFLPLAIKTNAPGSSSDFVYTPLDEANDWLLAKIAFNHNDIWYASFYHFASTHLKAEITYMAAFRTLSDDHPVLALLQRVMLQAFAYRPTGVAILFAPGQFVDKVFSFSGTQAEISAATYYALGAGDFQANYFHTQFAARGLIDSVYGPPLKHFPFYEDALPIHAALEEFMTVVVDTFYPNASLLENDEELQAWMAEAGPAGPAHIVDFPPALTQKDTLVNILTHMAYLTSVEHHVLNTNEPVAANGQLPFHPVGLYAPLPTVKGVSDIMPFLPNLTQAVTQIELWAGFARPEFMHSNQTLTNMWADSSLLAHMPLDIANAANVFQNRMLGLSANISARTFDNYGLSQGMPFVWRALDPQTLPYYLAI